MRILLSLLALAFVLSACNSKQAATILSTNNLQTQTYRINNSRDTLLKTAGGALLQISAGSFSSGKEVALEIKEAYLFEDMVRAGLTTQSDGKPLRSGGMIYVGTKDKGVKVVKPVRVSIPAKNVEAGMSVFKGMETERGINWVQPKALDDTLPKALKMGRAIFQANCQTCHVMDKELTGPAMRGVENRGPWNDRKKLFLFTRNPGGFIPLSLYTKCLAAAYNGQIMPSFPQLSDADLNSVYDYISFGTSRDVAVANAACNDSCRVYDSVLIAFNLLKANRGQLITDNGLMTEVDYHLNTSIGYSGRDSGEFAEDTLDYVSKEYNLAEYYKFSIDAPGWYNIDALLKDEDLPSSILTVKLEGEKKDHVDIYLTVPAKKIFTLAGRTNNPNEFAFYTKDGKIPLPQGVRAYVIAMSEDENGVQFGVTSSSASVLKRAYTCSFVAGATAICKAWDRAVVNSVTPNCTPF